jgi:hypothetical protein
MGTMTNHTTLTIALVLALYGCGGQGFSAAIGDGGDLADARGSTDVRSNDSGSIEAADGAVIDSGAADSGTVEAAAVDSSSIPVDAASDVCVPVTHSNGIGQTWTDCVPLGTYNTMQALKACAAFLGVSVPACNVSPVSDCGGGTVSIAGGTWTYNGPNEGHVQTSPNVCPSVASPMWD